MHIRQNINLAFPESPNNKSGGPQKTRNIQLHIENNFEQIKSDLQKLEISGHAFRVLVEVSRCKLEDYLWLVQKQREGLIHQLNLTDEGHKVFPTVAIVMFTFNRLKYTEQTLNRMMNSTHYPFELHIIDNNSTDGTREWLEEFKLIYANRIGSIRYNEKNMGLPGPTNQFWQSVNTDLVGKVDNDTLVPKGWLERLVHAHNKIPNLAVVGGYHFRPEDFDDNAAQAKIYKENGISVLTDIHIGGCCYLMKKTMQEKFGLMDVHPTLKTHGWTQYQWKLVRAGFIVGYLYPLVQLEYMDDPRSDKCLIETEYQEYARKIWRERGIAYQSTDQLVNWIQNDAARVTNQPVEVTNVPSKHPVKINNNHDKKPLVSIVILTYNQIEYTKLCIRSIKTSTDLPIEIVVVDNGSTDGTVEYLDLESHNTGQLFPFRVIKNDKNLGFAGGNNVGMAVAQGEYILLMNNDVVVTHGWIERMVACAQKHPMAGIIGPRSNYVSGPQLVTEVGYNTKTLEGLDTFSKQFAHKESGKSSQLLRVVGFCMLIKKAVVDKIGGLDTRYGLGNFEDDDYSLRAALAGYESWVAEDCFVHHFGSRTFLGAKIDFKKSLEKNWGLFKKKWGLPKDMPYGSSYNISQMNVTSIDTRFHYISLSVNGDGLLQEQLENLFAAEQVEANTILEKADRLFQKGQVDKGIETFLDGIRRFPEDYRIYVCLAEQLINCDRYQDALEALIEIPTELNSFKNTNEVQNAEISLLEGYCQEGIGNYEVADKLVEDVLRVQPDHPKALNLNGILAYRKNDKNLAKDFFKRAIDADPWYGEPYTNLGGIRWESKDNDEALKLFERGFILNPTDVDIASAYHEAVSALNEFNRAEQIVREEIDLYPFNRKLRYILIDLLIHLSKVHEALVEIEESIVKFGIDDGILDAALKLRAQLGPVKIKYGEKNASVSLCMIVKNEEKCIANCLHNLKPIVDEMVIVDTGSSDQTIEIARVFGARVFDFEWKDDFAAARNFSISKGNGDWILVMDADEVISPQDYGHIRKLTAKKPAGPVAYSIVTRNYCHKANTIGWIPNDGQYAQEEAAHGWLSSEKVRLFSGKNEICFEGSVHEMVEPFLKKRNISIKKCKTPVHHYGRLDAEKLASKGQIYYEIGRKKLAENGGEIGAMRELAIQATILEKNSEAIEFWQEFISMEPGNLAIAEAYVNLGTVYHRLKDYSKALASAKAAIKYGPYMKEAKYNLALAELYQGNASNAIEVLAPLLDTIQNYPPAQYILAASRCCSGDKVTGVKELLMLKGLQSRTTIVNSCTELADGLFSAGQVRLAFRLLEASIECEIVNKRIMDLYAKSFKKISKTNVFERENLDDLNLLGTSVV